MQATEDTLRLFTQLIMSTYDVIYLGVRTSEDELFFHSIYNFNTNSKKLFFKFICACVYCSESY